MFLVFVYVFVSDKRYFWPKKLREPKINDFEFTVFYVMYQFKPKKLKKSKEQIRGKRILNNDVDYDVFLYIYF